MSAPTSGVLYEMVAGRLPFAGETTTDVLGLILHKEPPPLTHVGMSYLDLTSSGADPAELRAKARAAAQKGLELDDSLAEAHSSMAGIKQFEWDWSGAENEYKRAIELNPNLAGGARQLCKLSIKYGADGGGAGREQTRAGA